MDGQMLAGQSEDPISNAVTPQPKSLGFMKFEDYFPPLNVEGKEERLASMFDRNLKLCVKSLKPHLQKWDIFRRVYALEYIEKFYPSLGVSANFTSGLLCEKVLEGVDRLSRAIFKSHPLFGVDGESSGVSDIDVMHKLEWFWNRVMLKELEIKKTIKPSVLFDFIIDGSAILQTSNVYSSTPERDLKVYTTTDELTADAERVLDEDAYEDAMRSLADNPGTPVRVLVERDVVLENGLKYFFVHKRDHLVPPGVYEDDSIQFRARRKYMTRQDLELLASSDVGWYEADAVKRILEHRDIRKAQYSYGIRESKSDNLVELNREFQKDLCYDWMAEMDKLGADKSMTPYIDTWAMYEIDFKFGYSTKKDPKGRIAHWCSADYDPESRTILRPTARPHLHECRDWIHFRFGHRPDSYYGFGFGDRLLDDDFLQSNAIDLYMDSSAQSVYNAFLCVHPDAGGRVPFLDGFGPLKIGYVNSVNDFKMLDKQEPPQGLIRNVIPMSESRTSNRTSITPTSQGMVEQGDPRSPAAKTQMLLAQAMIGIESMVDDWCDTGWNDVANLGWKNYQEKVIYEGEELIDDKWIFPEGTDIREIPDGAITFDFLMKDIVWVSRASGDFVNPEYRKQKFLTNFGLFAPMLQSLAQFNPTLAMKYLLRWLQQAGSELEVRNYQYLVPNPEEMQGMSQDQVQGVIGDLTNRVAQGSSPGEPNVQQVKEGQREKLQEAGGGLSETELEAY